MIRGGALSRRDLETATTFIFVPGSRDDRFDKAAGSGADVVIIDLEDAVAPADKHAARSKAARWLAAGGRAAVRINAPGTAWFEADLAAIGTAPIVLPKAESLADFEQIRATGRPEVPVVPLVESPAGMFNVREICGAREVVRVGFGNVDFAAQVGTDPASHAALLLARSQIVYGSSAAGVAAPVDGVTTAVTDTDRLVADAQHARDLGFTAKLLIHPSQVAPVTQVLQPTGDELRWARVVLSSAREGVGLHDGEMIDEPVLARARHLLRRSGAR